MASICKPLVVRLGWMLPVKQFPLPSGGAWKITFENVNCMKDIKQYSVHSFTRSSDWYFVSVQDRNHTFWQWFLCWNLWWKYDKVIPLERGKNLYQLQHPVKVQKSKFVLWKVRKWHNLNSGNKGTKKWFLPRITRQLTTLIIEN